MEELFQDIKYYVDLRIKRVKLHAVEQLSLLCGKAMAIIAFALVLLLAILILTGALIVAVAGWIGSFLWALLIVGGFYLLVSIVFYLIRDRLFRDSMVKTFSKMFFGNESNDGEEDYEED